MRTPDAARMSRPDQHAEPRTIERVPHGKADHDRREQDCDPHARIGEVHGIAVG
jgi:hypothetical protein